MGVGSRPELCDPALKMHSEHVVSLSSTETLPKIVLLKNRGAVVEHFSIIFIFYAVFPVITLHTPPRGSFTSSCFLPTTRIACSCFSSHSAYTGNITDHKNCNKKNLLNPRSVRLLMDAARDRLCFRISPVRERLRGFNTSAIRRIREEKSLKKRKKRSLGKQKTHKS